MADGAGGCGRWVILGIAGLIILPVFVSAGSTALFCRKVSSPASSEASCASEPGSPCAGALAAFEAAAAADTERLRSLLADPGWLERLPPTSTSSPEERGEFYVRMLLGDAPGSLEDLRGARTRVRAVIARTELAGTTAQVGLEAGSVETRKIIVEMKKRDGIWRLVPLGPR